MRPQKDLADLPARVGPYDLTQKWEGTPKYAGANWQITCRNCGDTRIVSTSIWNAAHKGRRPLRCVCQTGKVREAPTSRSRILLTHNGASRDINEWARITGISASAIYARQKKRQDGVPISDEEIIFGTDRSHPARTASEPEPSQEVDRALEIIRNEALRLLRPAVERIVLNLIEDRIRPLMYGLVNTGTLDPHPPLEIPPGMLIAKDGDGFYDPDPYPQDTELLFADATYRQVREDMGDELANIYWNDREQYKHQYLYSRPEPEAKPPKQNATVAFPDKRYYCIASHIPYLDRESSESIRIEEPITLPEGMPGQEETTPLTEDEVGYYLETPWWEHRMRRPHHIFNFGWVCRTQYERIVAWLRPSEKQYPKGADMAVALAPSYAYCTDHRTLNEYLDFFAMSEWSKDFTRLADPEDESLLPLLVARYERWSGSDVPKIRLQADALERWMPGLKDLATLTS